MAKSLVTDKDVQYIIDNPEKTLKEIAKMLGVSISTVGKALKRRGFTYIV